METNEEEGDLRIETARLILRRPRSSDAQAIAAVADDWAVASHLARMPHPYTKANAEEWISQSRSGQAESAFVITPRGGNAPIGACGIGPATWTTGREIGYWLGVRHWGQGFATEAARAMVDLSFGTGKLSHLWCSCRVTNEGSRRVIHKCGFQFHSAGMTFMRAAAASVAVEHYCLDRSVWLALNQWRAA